MSIANVYGNSVIGWPTAILADGRAMFYRGLMVDRWAYGRSQSGLYEVAFSGGVEAWEWLGRPQSIGAAIDDFGNLVRVQ